MGRAWWKGAEGQSVKNRGLWGEGQRQSWQSKYPELRDRGGPPRGSEPRPCLRSRGPSPPGPEDRGARQGRHPAGCLALAGIPTDML